MFFHNKVQILNFKERMENGLEIGTLTSTNY